MSEVTTIALGWLASLAVIASAIGWTVILLRMCNASEQEEGFIVCGGAASEMARGIRAKQEDERSRKS